MHVCLIFNDDDEIFLFFLKKNGREGDSLRVIDEKVIEEAKRWNNMSFTEKLGDFTARRQYSLIIGGWATSLGVAATIISRNKYQTFPQKVRIYNLLLDHELSSPYLDCTSSYVGSRFNNRIVDRCWCTHSWSTTSPSRGGK